MYNFVHFYFPLFVHSYCIINSKDYDYDIILDGGEVLTTSGIIVFNPSNRYIKKGSTSSYIITAKTKTQVELDTTEYYVDMTKSNIVLQGVGETDSSVKYKLDGNKGLYKLTVAGGEKEGYLYFNFKDLKDIEGKAIDTTTINSEISNVSNNKQIIVDNTAPTCSWSGENSDWTNNDVSITLTGVDNYKMNSSKSTHTKIYNQSGIELSTDNLSYEVEDMAGNKTTCSKTVNVYYDKKPPTKTVVDFHGYTLNTWTNQTVNRTFSATDGGSGVDHYEWSNDCVNIGGTEGSNSVPISWDGINTACHRAVDKVGNIGEWSDKNIVKIDKTAPTVPTITGEKLYKGSNVGTYTSNTWTNNDVRMNYSSTDSGVGGVYYQYSHDNSTWRGNNSNNGFVTTSTSWTITWESVYNYYIRACDGLNNCSSSSLMTIKIDRTPPVISSCTWQGPPSSINAFGINCSITDDKTSTSNIVIKTANCYVSKTGSTRYFTCGANPIDDRFASAEWRSISNLPQGFNIKLDTSTLSEMKYRISAKDEAGNESTAKNCSYYNSTTVGTVCK